MKRMVTKQWLWHCEARISVLAYALSFVGLFTGLKVLFVLSLTLMSVSLGLYLVRTKP